MDHFLQLHLQWDTSYAISCLMSFFTSFFMSLFMLRFTTKPDMIFCLFRFVFHCQGSPSWVVDLDLVRLVLASQKVTLLGSSSGRLQFAPDGPNCVAP